MGYWQNGLEFEKKVMLPYGDAALIRVNEKPTTISYIIIMKHLSIVLEKQNYEVKLHLICNYCEKDSLSFTWNSFSKNV